MVILDVQEKVSDIPVKVLTVSCQFGSAEIIAASSAEFLTRHSAELVPITRGEDAGI